MRNKIINGGSIILDFLWAMILWVILAIMSMAVIGLSIWALTISITWIIWGIGI